MNMRFYNVAASIATLDVHVIVKAKNLSLLGAGAVRWLARCGVAREIPDAW
jgi:hypothetical protein